MPFGIGRGYGRRPRPSKQQRSRKSPPVSIAREKKEARHGAVRRCCSPLPAARPPADRLPTPVPRPPPAAPEDEATGPLLFFFRPRRLALRSRLAARQQAASLIARSFAPPGPQCAGGPAGVDRRGPCARKKKRSSTVHGLALPAPPRPAIQQRCPPRGLRSFFDDRSRRPGVEQAPDESRQFPCSAAYIYRRDTKRVWRQVSPRCATGAEHAFGSCRVSFGRATAQCSVPVGSIRPPNARPERSCPCRSQRADRPACRRRPLRARTNRGRQRRRPDSADDSSAARHLTRKIFRQLVSVFQRTMLPLLRPSVASQFPEPRTRRNGEARRNA